MPLGHRFIFLVADDGVALLLLGLAFLLTFLVLAGDLGFLDSNASICFRSNSTSYLIAIFLSIFLLYFLMSCIVTGILNKLISKSEISSCN